MKNLAERADYGQFLKDADTTIAEGIAAAVATVACADLEAGLREYWVLNRATKVIDKLSQLPRKEILQFYKKFVAEIDAAHGIIPSYLWDRISALKSNPSAARVAAQLAFDVMAADGEMGAFEADMFIHKVCKNLGIDAEKDFGMK